MADEIRNEIDGNEDVVQNDGIQHGIDNDPNNDPEKARNIGGVGGVVTGLAAGAVAGPLGAIGGAIVGGVAGALGSQAAVSAVDKVDNDDTVSGIGHGTTERDASEETRAGSTYTSGGESPGIGTGGYTDTPINATGGTGAYGANTTTVGPDVQSGSGGSYAYADSNGPGNGIPGIQTGGRDADGSMDTRGITEKAEDTLTGDRIDDKTGKRVD